MQLPTYKIEDNKGQIIEGKYYEQELLISDLILSLINSFKNHLGST